MELALRLAGKAAGMTFPNPLVGAVIVDKKGQVIGRGFHKRAGEPHAEVMALRDAGSVPAGATMVVTLEPCNHYGRTPPCTLAIRQAGIKKVVVGAKDTNPGVKGGGIRYLRRAGVEVVSGVCEEKARRLNEAYFKHVTTGLPFVDVKVALGIDGKMAAGDGSSKWITSEYMRRLAHGLRNTVDAVVVGVGTIIKDDPELTVRLVTVRDRPLFRVIFDTYLTTPPGARVIKNQDDSYRTMLVTASRDVARIRALERTGARVVRVRAHGGYVSMKHAMDLLGVYFGSVLVEGGAGIMGAVFRERAVDKVHAFIAPKILGEDGLYPFQGVVLKNMCKAIILKDADVHTHDGECVIQGYPEWN